jgi:hypothetical protein
VALPDEGLLDLLVSEISQVDGVDVEDVHPLRSDRHDSGLTVLATATRLIEADDDAMVLKVLCEHSVADFECDWAVALRLTPAETLVEVGEAPAAAWVAAFVLGSRHLDNGADDAGPDDVAWADLGRAGIALAVGRKGRPFRWRERRQLAALARIAELRL